MDGTRDGYLDSFSYLALISQEMVSFSGHLAQVHESPPSLATLCRLAECINDSKAEILSGPPTFCVYSEVKAELSVRQPWHLSPPIPTAAALTARASKP